MPLSANSMQADNGSDRTRHRALGACHRMTFAYCVLVSCLSTSALCAQTPSLEVGWLDGASFTRQLQSRGSVFWKDGVLGTQLKSFGAHHHLCIWLDRRVDPGQTVNAQYNNVPLEQLLQQIVAPLRLGVCIVGSVVYIGPRDAASQLDATVNALRSEVGAMPAQARSALLRVNSAEWEVLTTPREALQRIAHEQQLSWTDLARIPHDLMPARTLPRLTVSEQLCLLLVGFDLSYRWDKQQQQLELAPMRKVKQLTQTYAVSGAKQAVFDRVLKLHPAATVATVDNRKRVTGTPALHDQLRRALRNANHANDPSKGPTVTKFRLKVPRQPLGGVTRQLAERFGWTVEFDDQVDPAQPVEFSVDDGSLDDLLQAMGAAANANVTLQGKVLKIAPK